MEKILKTVLNECHRGLGAQMVEFGGWDMPLQYKEGIIKEHMATRRGAGLFDVSHMGRFIIRGENALPFLQYALSNNAEALEPEQAQYTMIPNEAGGALDDAYLYRFVEEELLLVVNASNREKDWAHFQAVLEKFDNVEMTDKTFEVAMISLQGPLAKEIMLAVLESGRLPEPMRNELSTVTILGGEVRLARTGYTGEPICFELFVPSENAEAVWNLLLEKGAGPVGLGARDTLRLEADLPLYGHELGMDPEDREIPIFACPLARFAVSFSPLKGAFTGREALSRQFEALKKIIDRDYSLIQDLPRIIKPLELTGKGVARAGARVFRGDKHVGFVTSGTMVPYWKFDGEGIESRMSEETSRRAIALAMLDSDLLEGDEIAVEIRGKRVNGVVAPYHLRAEAPPFARAITLDMEPPPGVAVSETDQAPRKAAVLIEKAIVNTRWRQRECVNLIPSEQTPSPMVRMLSIMDPVCRYAEHKPVKAFNEAEVFYYQGTEFIAETENLLIEELRTYMGCEEIETRPISGQMANTAVFSALVDFINRADRKSEQRRLRSVLNNHIIKGGHLSAQPMGALRDYVARDPKTEKPAAVNFPVTEANPYLIDVAACREIMEEHRPELIILGKSMTLHKEPVAEIRAIIDELSLDCVLLYDMAHVLGLVGPHFQEPFKEGADIVTGSTHKTYFGSQRGIVAVNYQEQDKGYDLWEAIQRRAFPGSTSNHHLGTLLALLMAAYEMNAFKDEYQENIIANAKAFANALKDRGLDVAGDPAISFTETHQVILDVGYARGPDVASLLEKNNIVLNYQAGPHDEGFTASGSLRMGVSEMTRFGMGPADFEELAELMHDVIVNGRDVKEEVKRFRERFLEMRYCFSGGELDDLVGRLREMACA
ncbi:MAG: glycine cleavage system aminomethyltransferase GcvT [Desulfobacterales bacterium]|nr:glycine cleavage system aminomethyltransferase GcvT [Desulfobacterales bacterium]